LGDEDVEDKGVEERGVKGIEVGEDREVAVGSVVRRCTASPAVGVTPDLGVGSTDS
jgi:hypothetical protein